MAVTTIPTAGIADDAVGNTKLNLASDYAFTGTISGTPQGLTLINSTSSTSTVEEFSIDNIFTSTYKFYKVYMRVEYSQNTGFYMRLIQSGGSARTANYYQSEITHVVDETSGIFSANNNVSTFYIGRGSGGNVAGGGNRGHHYVMDFYDPFGSMPTHMYANAVGYHDSNGNYYANHISGTNTNAEAHRGFLVKGNSNNNIIQHDVKVYGVTNA